METINRNNYEEYFLLYIDGELDAASTVAVENFVHQNPDLAVELDMLAQTKLLPEETNFFDKENLLRTEGNSINESNHEEYFLLYIDNELSAAKREEVEMYVLQHPKLQDEFTTLKKAVLTAEEISYGDKKNLYRTEKRRAIYLQPWRLAAAAIFIGVCAIGWWLVQKPSSSITVADKNKVNQPAQHIGIKKPADTIQQQIKKEEQVVAQQSSTTVKENKKESIPVIAESKKEKANTNDVAGNKHNEQQQTVAQHPQVAHNKTENGKEPPAEIHDAASATETFIQQQNEVASLQTPAIDVKDANNFKIYPVAYKEINTNDDNNSLHVGAFDLNKAKVKNLLKKAGRLFSNKSNNLANDDGKLQVANFEIETNK